MGGGVGEGGGGGEAGGEEAVGVSVVVLRDFGSGE